MPGLAGVARSVPLAEGRTEGKATPLAPTWTAPTTLLCCIGSRVIAVTGYKSSTGDRGNSDDTDGRTDGRTLLSTVCSLLDDLDHLSSLVQLASIAVIQRYLVRRTCSACCCLPSRSAASLSRIPPARPRLRFATQLVLGRCDAVLRRQERCRTLPYPTLPYPTLPFPPYPSLPYPTLHNYHKQSCNVPQGSSGRHLGSPGSWPDPGRLPKEEARA